MVSLNHKKNSLLKGVLFSSFTIAFAGLGDALLYLVLPVYGAEFGFSALWIGVFLSINRFVRIPGNAIVALAVARKGYKTAMKVAACLAVASTFIYGFKVGVLLFLLARIVWGLSYSSLRISSLAYAAEAIKNKHLMFGLLHSIKTMGAVIALFFGPILINYYGVKMTFVTMSGFSLIAVFFAFRLPEIQTDESKVSLKKLLTFNNINTLTFLTSFIIDGVLVVTLSKLFTDYKPESLIAIVGGYLLFRKFCSVIMSIISGRLSDLFGVKIIFKIALIFVLISLLFIGLGYSDMGIIIAFLFNSFIVALLPSIALLQKEANKLETLTSITTWWDVGAASGTLVGLLLLEQIGVNYLYFGFMGILFLSIIVFFRNSIRLSI